MKTKKNNNINNNNRTRFKKKYCSPKNNNNFTCFTKKSIIKMLNSWNNFYTNDKIIYKESDKLYNLWSLLDNKLKNVCNDEYCWTKQKFIDSNEKIILHCMCS